jgi:hypothetical protein
MMAEPSSLKRHWWSAARDQRDALVDALDDANLLRQGRIHRNGISKLPRDPHLVLRRGGPVLESDETAAAEILTTVAWREARGLARRLWVPVLLWSAMCSQGERAQWLKLAFNAGARRRWRDQVMVMQRVLEARAINHSDGALERKRSLGRQVSRRLVRSATPAEALYNGACFFALLARGAGEDAERFEATAVSFLEQALRESPNQLVSAAWLRADPDFKDLQAHPQFKRVVMILDREHNKGT